MPQFFFNIYDGKNIPDDEGIELKDFTHARLEAMRYAAEIIREGAHKTGLGKEWRLEVTDSEGLILFRLDLFTTIGASIGE